MTWNSLRQLVGIRYGKKIFCQNSDYFGDHFIKSGICIYVFTLYLQKTHFLSLFKIYTLNVTMYILILTCL